MEQIDMFGFEQEQALTRFSEYHNPGISADDRVRCWRYAQAAFGSGPAGSPVRVESLRKDIGRLQEFIIVPNAKFRSAIEAKMGEPRDDFDQKYLTNLYTHTETVAMLVQDLTEYADNLGPLGCMHLFTVATIYETRLLVFWEQNKLETEHDWKDWIKSLQKYFEKNKKFELASTTELYSK